MEILALITILYIFAFLIALIHIDNKVSKMENRRKEDMELIKGMLKELNRKTFEPPFDIKTFPESGPSKPLEPSGPFDPWGHTCVYACPTAPYVSNITTSITSALNEEDKS